VILIGLAFAGAGRYMQFIPLPVVEGFTIGIAVIIGLQQVPAALGVDAEGEKVVVRAFSAIRIWLQEPAIASLLIALVVAGVILLTVRFRPGVPASMFAVIIATLAVGVFGIDVATIGVIPSGLPSPSIPQVSWSQLSTLMIPAIAIAALAALESLLSATVADAMSVGERHDSNRELFGQGIANIASPLFGGVPATAAIARTAVNVRSGAQSRLAAITQSIGLLLVILVASRWVSFIPLAALAGVLFATVIQMIEISSVRALLRATRGDAAILVATAAATIAFDLVTAVIIGMAIAGIYALRQVAKSARIDEMPLDQSDHSDAEWELLKEHVVAYRLDGPLFFGAAHRFLLEISEVSDVRVVILRLSRIRTLDATGASVLGDTIKSLEQRGVTVMLSGVQPEHELIFRGLGVFGELAHEKHVFLTTPEAINHARAHALR
jgi:SulP family sulfate permease